MSIATSNPLEQFRWTPQPAAEQLLKQIIDPFLQQYPEASQLRDRMRDEAGIRFFDCIDHIVADQNDLEPRHLLDSGFERSGVLGGSYVHPGGIFPPVVV